MKNLSITTIQQYLRCGYQYYLTHIEKAPSDFSENLAIGSIYHEGIATWYRTGGDFSAVEEAVRSSFAWEKKWDYDNVLTEEHFNLILDLIKEYAEYFNDELNEYSFINERDFSVEIGDDLIIGGTADMVLENKSTGRKILVEHKTAKRKWSETKALLSLQLQFYNTVFDCDEVQVRVVLKQKKKSIQVLSFTKDELCNPHLIAEITNVKKAIDSKIFLPVRDEMTCKHMCSVKAHCKYCQDIVAPIEEEEAALA